MEENISEKRFEKLQDFNLVYLSNFQEFPIASMIQGSFLQRYPEKVSVRNFLVFKKLIENPEIPFEVMESFKQGQELVLFEGVIYKKVVENGEVFYDSFKDAGEKVREILALSEIKETIQVIIDNVGRQVLSRNLFSLSGFSLIENEVYGDLSLSFKEESFDGKQRTCRLVLTNVKDSNQISVDLGLLTYSVFGRR